MTELAATPSKILVIKLADLGDVLTATPALRALRQAYPEAIIDLLLTHHTQTLMQHASLVNNLIPSDNFRFFSPGEMLKPGLLSEALQVLRQVRRRGYDTVLVLHHLTTLAGAFKYALIAKMSGARTILGLDPGGLRGRFLTRAVPDLGFGARHEIAYWLAMVDLLTAQTGDEDVTSRMEMDFACSAADTAWAGLMLDVLHPQTRLAVPANTPPLVVIHPGSGGFSVARRWPAANFAAVADALSAQGAKIVVVGTASDGTEAMVSAMTNQPLDLTGQTTLHQLAALLKRADLYIGGDSGVTHIAAASGIPLVSVFGPTNAQAWGPVGPQRQVLQANIPCGPCAYVDHMVGLRMGCEARTCLKLISPEAVLEAAQTLLADKLTQSDPRVQQCGAEIEFIDCNQIELPYSKVDILGVQVHQITFDQALEAVESFVAAKSPHQIVTVNPEFIMAAQGDPLFRRVINRAALALPDGSGLVKAAKWLGQPRLPERIAGVDFVEALANLSARKGYRLYFLGAQPGIAEKAIAILQQRYPQMVAVGAFAGSPQAEDEDQIVAQIQAAAPDIVFVAYGAPHQDTWIARNMARLPAAVLIGVGGSFDFISGATQRAPQWAQSLGLEWLHRWLKQPSRWRRIWNAVPRFLWAVFWARMRH